MIINVITRCTRVHNLEQIKENVFNNENPDLTINWHVVFDTGVLKDIDAELLHHITIPPRSRGSIDIHYVRGFPGEMMYPQCSKIAKNCEGWVYLLDDDNLIHEDFYQNIYQISTDKKHVDKKVIIVAQHVARKDFTGLEIREAKPEHTKYQHIDIAQMVLHSDIFDKYSFTGDYAADGFFIEKVLKDNEKLFVWENTVLSHYNYLEKEPKARVPKILYIGPDKPDLVSLKVLDYEDVSLNVKHVKSDMGIMKIIADFNPDCIVTRGDSWKEHTTMSMLPEQFRRKWIHLDNDKNIQDVGQDAYQVSMTAMLSPSNLENENLISFFTPIYNTGNKLENTYKSLTEQTYPEWEWVLINDSTDGGKTLKIAEQIASQDPRVKVYDFREKSGGCIGEAKYRACVLAKGYILAELDHDDLLVPWCAEDLHKAAQKHPECGFFWNDTLEVDENWNSLTYEDGFAFGYGKYRTETYKGMEVQVADQHNINPKTIRHIVGVPNHTRAWRRSTYFEIGGHNRNLTIADDYELVVRTFLHTKMCRIPKLGYVQFIYNNNSGRNTHDLSRADIQRRVRTIMYYYNEAINKRFLELGLKDWAYDENPNSPLWSPSRYGKDESAANIIYEE
jgi:glycosyltransferase involved in cell wall biosynthesis